SFFKDLSPTDFSSLSLHDALPIYYFFPIHLNHSSFFNSYRHNGVDWKLDHIFCGKKKGVSSMSGFCSRTQAVCWGKLFPFGSFRSEEHTSELQSRENLVCRLLLEK